MDLSSGPIDNFISQLEDVLAEDKQQGRLVQSLTGFADVVSRAAFRTRSDGLNVLRGHNGKYVVALPDGTIKADSNNPNGDWEQFEYFPVAGAETVVIRNHHKKYLIAFPDGTLRADSTNPYGYWEQFELIPTRDNQVAIRSHHGQYLISLPDGCLQASSDNPDNDWEQFEVIHFRTSNIKDQDALFRYFDELSAKGGEFGTLTYVVNDWTLGGVVKMRHHACILSEAGGKRHLKFDFGRWGVGWSLTAAYPEHPKGTFHVEAVAIKATPQKVKRYLTKVHPFSWTGNNCSTFARGLMQELNPSRSSLLPDPWPEWSHCLSFPPLKAPSPMAPFHSGVKTLEETSI